MIWPAWSKTIARVEVVPWSIEMTWVFSGSCPLLEDPFAEDFAEADGAAQRPIAAQPGADHMPIRLDASARLTDSPAVPCETVTS